MSTIKVDGVETTDATKDMRFSTNSTEAMCIDTDGNVGIGTSSPTSISGYTGQTLNNATNGGFIDLQSNGETAFRFLTNGSVNNIETRTATPIVFLLNSTERARIDSNGSVTVGSPSFDAIVAGSTAGCALQAAGTVWGSRQNDAGGYFNTFGSNGAVVILAKEGVTVGTITVTDAATSYNTSSDYRLKTDAQPMTGASARVQALNPINFEWIVDGSRTDGFLAHEAQAVVPEAVTGTKDAVDENGKPKYQGIDQSKLVPLLTAALQEALTRIEALESKA